MSKRAEQKALELYPILFAERNGYNDGRKELRVACQYGYEQAEKDLALTWDDIPKLIELTGKTFRYFSDNERPDVPLQELYEEVLRRFNETREKK